MSNQLQAPSRSAIRAELEQLVLGDLHGPAGGPEEELNEASVSERYLTGMLAPRRKPVGMELFDELAVAGRGSAEDGKADITATGGDVDPVVVRDDVLRRGQCARAAGHGALGQLSQGEERDGHD